MQLAQHGWWYCIIAAVLSVNASCAGAQHLTRTSIDISSGGDTALDKEMEAVLARSFANSERFVVRDESMQRRIVVQFDRNVRPDSAVGSDLILYEVNYWSPGVGKIGARKGKCPRSEIEECAQQIVDGATSLASKIDDAASRGKL